MEIDLTDQGQRIAEKTAEIGTAVGSAGALSIDAALEPSAREHQILDALRARMNSEPLLAPLATTEAPEEIVATAIVPAQKGKALQKQLTDLRHQLERAEKISEHLSRTGLYKSTRMETAPYLFVAYGLLAASAAVSSEAAKMLPVVVTGTIIFGACWAFSSGLLGRIFHTPKAEAAALSEQWQDEALPNNMRFKMREQITAAQRERVESLRTVYQELSRQALGLPSIVKLKIAPESDSVLQKISTGNIARADIVEALSTIERNFDQFIDASPVKTEALAQGATEIVEDLGRVLADHSVKSERRRALHETIETLGAALEL